MNRHAKSIKSTLRPQIENIKGYILDSKRGFDGTGYAFKKAMSELRRDGHSINYDIKKCLYFFTAKEAK